MTKAVYDRPAASEYAPFYHTYVGKVPDGDLVALLTKQAGDLLGVLRSVPEDRGGHAYASGKWTIKEVLGHLVDTERVMSYRALSFARADTSELPSFDENAWVPAADSNSRTLASLIDEFLAVRSATVAMLSGLPADAAKRTGTASGKQISVRALGYVICGHVTHHLGVLQERYLG